MKVEYDVKMPRQYLFWDFYNSEHENCKIECDDEHEAQKTQQSFLMLIGRKKIFDVIVMRRKNVVYLVKK